MVALEQTCCYKNVSFIFCFQRLSLRVSVCHILLLLERRFVFVPVVRASCCPCVMLSVRPAVSMSCCQCVMLSVRPAVSASCCQCVLLSVRHAVCASCCLCVLLSVRHALRVSCCQCVMLSVYPVSQGFVSVTSCELFSVACCLCCWLSTFI